MNEENENDLIKGYYFKDFEYKADILRFLYQYHGISISKSPLQLRLKSYDVSRKYAEYNIDAVVNEKRALLDGPECMGRYKFFWQRLKMKGHQVLCNIVQLLLSQFGPEMLYAGMPSTKEKSIPNEGPYAAWHEDGYDRLKPHGFVKHGVVRYFGCLSQGRSSILITAHRMLWRKSSGLPPWHCFPFKICINLY